MTTPISKVAFIGLGAMGTAMTRNLMNAGYPLTVYARRAEAMQPFGADGARATQRVDGTWPGTMDTRNLLWVLEEQQKA